MKHIHIWLKKRKRLIQTFLTMKNKLKKRQNNCISWRIMIMNRNETKQYIQQLETDKKCLNDQLSKMSEQHMSLVQNKIDTERYHSERVKV